MKTKRSLSTIPIPEKVPPFLPSPVEPVASNTAQNKFRIFTCRGFDGVSKQTQKHDFGRRIKSSCSVFYFAFHSSFYPSSFHFRFYRSYFPSLHSVASYFVSYFAADLSIVSIFIPDRLPRFAITLSLHL